jgi:DNA-binding NarL/FixJ family response regulator
MIKLCLADNHPVVHYGMKSFFNDNPQISFVGVVNNLDGLLDVLNKNSRRSRGRPGAGRTY